MWLIQFFYCQIRRKSSRIYYLNPIVVDCQTYSSMYVVVIAMAQCVYQSLTQSLLRNFQSFHPPYPDNLAVKIQVLETKIHASIQQIKEIASCLTIINKFIFIQSSETRHSQQKLRIVSTFLCKKHNCRL